MATSAPEFVEDCFGLIHQAIVESGQRRFENAKRAIGLALLNAREMPAEFTLDFRVALCYGALLVEFRESPATVTPERRAEAAAMLTAADFCDSIPYFHVLMFLLLRELGEHRRAIPFAERALAAVEQTEGPAGVANWLLHIGGCYSGLGLRDHAAISYRAAVRLFRNEIGDPRLPLALLSLGNSLRKTARAEAEGFYGEAAKLWEDKGQLLSATPAWMNLGIVCSDQNRFEEALDYYERVRRIRESAPGTRGSSIAALYNNLAVCYRQMARFSEAHQLVDRALGLFGEAAIPRSGDARSYFAALSTKGMILRDEGRHFDSIEWFHRARAGFESQPSPNVENVIQELEHEAAALMHLNRVDEARVLEEKARSVRNAAAADVPPGTYANDTPVSLKEGALLIEISRGKHESYVEALKLGSRLAEIVQDQKLGEWHGVIRIPECSVLAYYGPNADAIYAAIEPTMRDDPRFEGALVTIRQHTESRQVLLPSRMLN